MARTLCGERRLPKFTRRRATFGRYSYCWATPRWTALLDTLALSLKMRWLSPKLSKSKAMGRLHGRPRPALGFRLKCCAAASPDRPFVHRAALSKSGGLVCGTFRPCAGAAVADAENLCSRSVENLAAGRISPERPLKVGLRRKIQTSLSLRVTSTSMRGTQPPDADAAAFTPSGRLDC